MTTASSYLLPAKSVVGINTKFPNPSKGYSVDGSILQHRFVDYLPTNSIDHNGGVSEHFVEFSVPPSREFIDLSQIHLFVEIEVKKGAGGREPCVATDLYSLVNGTLNSLWSSVEVMLNGCLVQERNDMHGFVSYLQTMLGMPQDCKDTIGAAMGYKEGIIMDKTTLAKMTDASKANLPEAVKNWMKQSEKSTVLQFCGPLYMDLSSMDAFLLDGVGLSIRLHRQQNSYLINTPTADANYQCILRQCRLLVRKVSPSTNAHIALNQSLEIHGAQRYFYKRVSTKMYNLQASESARTVEDPFMGIVPNMLLVAIVPSSALNGNYAEDPHCLSHHNLSRLAVTIDGNNVYDFHPDYDKNLYMLPYYHMFQNFGILESGINGITAEDYKNGKNVYIFDLTSDDQSNSNSNLTLDRKGLLRLNFKFKKNPGENLVILLIGVSQAGLAITSDRRVLTSQLM